MTKAELRREMRLRLKTLGGSRTEKSRAICEAIRAHPSFERSRRVALYSPLPSEPDLNGLWDPGVSQTSLCSPEENGERTGAFRQAQGLEPVETARPSEERSFCYPRVAEERIEFVEIARLEDLVQAAWNPWVREPALAATHIIAPTEIDLILVPGLAFTRDGFRLGRGGGFYDRFLAQLPAHAVKLGVCFDLQLVETLPTEAHDQRLDSIVTESGLAAPLH